MSYTFHRLIATVISDLLVQNDVKSYSEHTVKDIFGIYMDLFSLSCFLLLSVYTYLLFLRYKNEVTLEFLWLSVRNLLLISMVCIVGGYVVTTESLPLSIRDGAGYLSLILIAIGIHQSSHLIWGWICFTVKHAWLLLILFIDISLLGYILS